MLNLWIGMCRGAKGLPTHLRDLGYDDKWIELSFANSEMETVVPDLIVSSRRTQHTLLLEWKSGANTEPEQLRRYSRVTPDDLRTQAALSEAEYKSHDVTVLGKSEFADRLKIGINEGKYGFPLLVLEDAGLRLVHNQFVCQDLNGIFIHLLKIDLSKIPESFVPFDQDSELWEIAYHIIPRILVYMHQRDNQVLLDGLAWDTVATWKIMSGPHRKALREKMSCVLDEAARAEFSKYLLRNTQADKRAQTKVWDIMNNPLDLQTKKHSQAFQVLKLQQSKFIERLRRGGQALAQSEFDFDV
jgi:hypothetical protein